MKIGISNEINSFPAYDEYRSQYSEAYYMQILEQLMAEAKNEMYQKFNNTNEKNT